MPTLSKQQKKELEAEIQTPKFKDGSITTADIGRKYNLSWKRAKDAINAATKRIEYAKEKENKTAIPEETFTVERLQAEEKAIQTPLEEMREYEERDELKMEQKKYEQPSISLIEQPKTETQNANILDGNKFYCATCLRVGRQTILETNMSVCPGCKGVLKWEN